MGVPVKRALLDPAAAPASPTAWVIFWGPRPPSGTCRGCGQGEFPCVQPDTSTRDTWTEPGTFEIARCLPDPAALPTTGCGRSTSTCSSTAGLVLIDAGWAITAARAGLDEGMDKRGCPPGTSPHPGHPCAPRSLHPGGPPAARVRHDGGLGSWDRDRWRVPRAGTCPPAHQVQLAARARRPGAGRPDSSCSAP